MTHPGGQEDIQDAGSPARAQRIGLVALLALATLAILVIAAAPASADTVSVCQDESCDHETIQDAIDAAAPGDTILIGTGVYNEAIQVDKDELTLCQADEAFTQCGSQPGAVVIDPLGKALYPVFIGDLQAPVSDIVLQGVTVQNPLYDTADQDFGTVDPSLVVIYGDRVTLRNAILQAAAAPLAPGESRWHTTGVNIGHTLDGAEDPSDDIVIEDVVIRDLPASQGADKTVCPAAPCRTTAINNWGGGDGFTVRDTLIDLGGGGCDPAEAPDGHCRTTGATLGIHGSGNTDTLIENTRIDGGPTGADATLGAGDGIRGHFPDSTIRDNVLTGWARHGAIVWGAGLTVEANTLQFNGDGLKTCDDHPAIIQDNTIEHATFAAIAITECGGGDEPVFRGNQMGPTNTFALRIESSVVGETFDARLNDWGVVGREAIAERIQDHGQANAVLQVPYLDAAGQAHPPLPAVHCFVDTDGDEAPDRLHLAGHAMDLQAAVDVDLTTLDPDCREGHRTLVLSEDAEAYRGAVIDKKVSLFSQATGRMNTLTDGAASGGARILAEPGAPALTFLPGSDATNPDLPGRDGSFVDGLALELAPGATGILADGLDTDGPSVAITNTRLLAGLDAHATTGVLARNGGGPTLDSNTLLGIERPIIYDATTGGAIVSNHIEANEDVPGLGRTSQGLLLQDTTDALVSGNTIDVNGHPAWTGATIRGGAEATLEDNTITRGTLGIKATGTSNVQLEANTVLVSKLAIDLSGVEGATVTDNRLEGSGFQINPATPSFGVHVHDATSDWAITGNALSNWDFAAINVASDAGPGGTIDANTLTGTWRFGVLIGQADDVSITANDFTGSGLNAINLEQSTGTLVEGNTIRLDLAPGFGAPNALDTPEACGEEPTEDCIGEPAAGLWIQGAQDAVVRANSFAGSVDAVAITTFFHTEPPVQPSLDEMSDNRLLSTADSLRIGEDVQELDLDARSNDWGAYECAAIRERIRDLGTDNLVRINPFLTPDGELKGCEIPTEPGVVHNAATGDAFFSIQDAIDAASQDDTLLVGPGAYHEALTVNTHGLTICQADEATATCGSDPADVVVDAMGTSDYTVSVRGLDVTLQGITLKNTGLEGNGGAVKLERDSTVLDRVHIELEGQQGNLVTGIEVKGVADDALILNSELRGLPAGPEDRGARPNNGIHGELTGVTIQGTLFQGWGSNAVFPSAGTQGISILDNTFRAVGTGVLLCESMDDPVVNGNTFTDSIRGILLCGIPGPGGEINLRGNTFAPSVTTALGLDGRTHELHVDVRLSDWGVNHHRLIDQRVDDQGTDNTVLQIPFLTGDGSPEPPLVRIEGNAPSFLSIQEAIEAAEPGARILVGASASPADPTPRPESLTLSTEDIEVCGTVAGGPICASDIGTGHQELSRAEWADAPGLGAGEAVLFDNAGTPDHRSTSLFPPDGATIEDIDRFAFDLYLAEGDCSEMDLGGLVAIDETPGDDSHDRDRLVEITPDLADCVEGEWFHVDFFDEDTRWNFAGDTTRAQAIASINERYPSGGYEVSAVNLVQTDGATVSYVDNQVIGDTVLGERQDTTCFVTADTACRQDTALDRTIVDATSVADRVVRMGARGTSVEGLTLRWSGDEGGALATRDNTLIGVHIAADDVTVEGNQIRVGNVDAFDFAHGVKIDSVAGAKVLDNEIRAVLAGTDQPAVQTNSGIITYNTQGLEIRGNTITGWVSHGGFINTDKAPVIADNTFAENQRGLSICNNEDPHLEGNLFTGNLQAIWFCGSPVDADNDGAGATLRANTFGLDADPGTLVLDGNVQDAVIDAQFNDWGVYKCTLIEARINDAGSGNEVDFTPYLDELGEARFGCEERSEDGDVFVNGAEWASASDPADTASNPVTQATSPVVNPGFEAGISGWLPLDNAPGQAPSLAEHEIVEGPTGKAFALVSDGSGETRVEQRFDVTGAGLPVVLGGSALTVDLLAVDGGTARATVCYATQACQAGVGAHGAPLEPGANRIELTNTEGEPLVRIVLSAPDAPGASAVFDNVVLEGATTQAAETCDTALAARCANTGELAAGSSVMATDGIALQIQRTEVDTFVVTALDADTGDQVDLGAPAGPGSGTGLFVHALASDDADPATGNRPVQTLAGDAGVWTVTLDSTSDEPIPALVRVVAQLPGGDRVEGFYNVAKLVTPLDELDAVPYPTFV